MKQPEIVQQTRRRVDRFDLVLAALFFLIFLAILLLPLSPKKYGDLDFHIEAKTVALALKGEVAWTEVAITKAPAPVLYYTIPYVFVQANSDDRIYWWAAVSWSFLWMLVSLLLVRRAGEMLGGPVVGKLTAVLTLLTPFNAYYSLGVLAEPPAYLGVVVLIYGWMRWLRSGGASSPFKNGAWMFWGGISLFLLSRPNGILFLPIAILVALGLLIQRFNQYHREAKFIGYCCLIVLSVITTTSVIVKNLPGKRPTATQLEYLAHAILQGRFQFRSEPWDWRFWGDEFRQGSVDYAAWKDTEKKLRAEADEIGVEFSFLQWQWIFNDVLQNPVLFVKMAGVRALAIHVATVNSWKRAGVDKGPLLRQVLFHAFHFVVNSLTMLLVMGSIAYLLLARKQWPVHWVLWAPYLALFLFHCLTYAEPRYLFPSRPGLVLMSSVAFMSLLRYLRPTRSGSNFYPPKLHRGPRMAHVNK